MKRKSVRAHICRNLGLGLLLLPALARAEEVREITQHGVTWKFDNPCRAGRFVTGDWWVVGPVKVVGVTPAPGPSLDTQAATTQKSRYGAAGLVDDKRMRNGSMILSGPDADPKSTGFDRQGYESRSPNYSPELSVAFPCELQANQSLISTISSETLAADGKLATPFLLGEEGMFLCPKTMPLALESAAVLTCLDKEPAADAFRPPYAGSRKPIYRAKDLRWNLLPALKPVASTPDWAKIERLFERPWLDTSASWMGQYMLPGKNQPNYGREFARMSSIAALMLLLDVPKAQKEKLLIEYVQLGIDLHGLAECGRQWFSDGGHWQGRKWPILFASLMLDQEDLRKFPPVNRDRPVYGRFLVSASPGVPVPTTLFQEDLDTYYGKGGDGQTALWQIVSHTGPRVPYEEKPRETFTKDEKWLDDYRPNNSAAWIGAALAAQFLKAKAIWNHDAYFDYMDRWMSPEEKWNIPKWLPKGCTRSFDLFAEEMWNSYRPSAPQQPGGQNNLKWVWDEGGKAGRLVLNPKGAP